MLIYLRIVIRHDLDPERVAKAKALSRGPLGQQDAKYPLLVSRALFFGEPPNQGVEPVVNNGTATLLRFNEDLYAVTCWHVIDAYLRRRARNPALLLQLGNTVINIDSDLRDYSETYDLAVLDLRRLVDVDLRNDGVPGSTCHQPVRWPPELVSVGDFVSLGGYPGVWREKVAHGEYSFPTFSVGTTPVAATNSDRVIVQFDREYWVSSFDYDKRDDLGFDQLGGLSGGPAFVWRGLHFELVGIVYEFSPAFDLVMLRPACLLGADGKIHPPSER